MGDEGTYTMRYGWTRAGVTSFLAVALLVAAGFLPWAQRPGTSHVELALSPVALGIAALCSSRRPLVRLDGKGLTLYPHPFQLTARRTELVPWSEVLAVNWSAEPHLLGRTSTLTVYRRDSRPRKAGSGPAAAPDVLDVYLATQVSPDFVATFQGAVRISRATTLGRVEPARLALALTRLAPGVRHFGDLGDLGHPGGLGGPGGPAVDD
ncbi:hypothetical protein ACIQU5_16575 [Streptomyces sp. NPDC090306]|uniref:hypothetical protein n=1 Tax=Streptomyces sp. NPDC090306 TaxID=3365961 RepID=UPI003805029E